MLIRLNKYLQSLTGHTSPNSWIGRRESSTKAIKPIPGSPGVYNSAGQMDYSDRLLLFLKSQKIETVGMSLKQTLTFLTQRIPDK